MSNNPTPLPEELLKQIDSDANDYVGRPGVEFSRASADGYIAGATEYAVKLQEAKELLKQLLDAHEKEEAPDYYIFKDIKKFLYGE